MALRLLLAAKVLWGVGLWLKDIGRGLQEWVIGKLDDRKTNPGVESAKSLFFGIDRERVDVAVSPIQ
jgi:hypothetical protein